MDSIARVLDSLHWRRFLEDVALGLRLNLTVATGEHVHASVPAACPRCGRPYPPVGGADLLDNHAAAGEVFPIDGATRLLARACPCTAPEDGLPLAQLAGLAADLLRAFPVAPAAASGGGAPAAGLMVLRQVNRVTLALFMDEATALERAFGTLASATAVLLDAAASWVESGEGDGPGRILRGDAAPPVSPSTPTAADVLVAEAGNGRVRCRAGVRGAADPSRAEALLPALAREALVVLEIGRVLRVAQAQLARVRDAHRSALLVLDAAGLIAYANAPAARLLGERQAALLGRPAADCPVLWSRAQTRATGGAARGQPDAAALSRRDAATDWELAPLLDGGVRAGWILRTGERTREAEPRGTGTEAADLYTGTQTIRVLAHELRNPLTVLRGLLRLIHGGRTPDLTASYAAKAMAEVDRVSQVLDEFLLLGRPAEMAARPADLGRFVAGLLPSVEAALHGRSVALAADLADDVPARFDGEQIRQLVLNLVRNAGDAVEAATGPCAGGRVEITVRRERGGAVLSVRDNGPGIPPEDIERVFEPGFTTKHRGTGLGLAVCQAVARHHGGRLTAENPQGGGARFTLWLPLAPAVHPE